MPENTARVGGTRAIKLPALLNALRSTLRAIGATREGKIGLSLVLFVIIVGLAGPAIAPHDPERLGDAPAALPPSGAYLLGTDTLGRDVLSRVLSGGHNVLVLPLLATVLAFATGGLAGMALAYRGGKLDLFEIGRASCRERV